MQQEKMKGLGDSAGRIASMQFSGDPCDLSRVSIRPQSGPCPVPHESPRVDIMGASGCREAVEFPIELLQPCEVGEAISWAGASGVHVGGGDWRVIAPGASVSVHHLGEFRSVAVFEFVSLVRSMWPIREHALKLLTEGEPRIDNKSREVAP